MKAILLLISLLHVVHNEKCKLKFKTLSLRFREGKHNMKPINNGPDLYRSFRDVTRAYLCFKTKNDSQSDGSKSYSANSKMIVFKGVIFECNDTDGYAVEERVVRFERNKRYIDLELPECPKQQLYYYWPAQRDVWGLGYVDSDTQIIFIFDTMNPSLKILSQDSSPISVEDLIRKELLKKVSMPDLCNNIAKDQSIFDEAGKAINKFKNFFINTESNTGNQPIRAEPYPQIARLPTKTDLLSKSEELRTYL